MNAKALATLLQAFLLPASLAAQQYRFPGTVIDYSAAETGKYIGSPSLAILPNGVYVASHDLFGPASGEKDAGTTRIFISSDRGVTWKHQTDLRGQFWSNLQRNSAGCSDSKTMVGRVQRSIDGPQ